MKTGRLPRKKKKLLKKKICNNLLSIQEREYIDRIMLLKSREAVSRF